MFCAMVTKNLTSKEDLESPAAIAALQDEIAKLMKYKFIERPGEYAKLAQEYATRGDRASLSKLMTITGIKFMERAKSEPKHKARGVARGDLMFCLLSGKRWRVHETELWCPVLSLVGMRLVMGHGLVHKQALQAIDVESAYLQTEWPSSGTNVQDVTFCASKDKLEDHFLELARAVRNVLPKEFNGDEFERPVWRMSKCVYGHPRSGPMFVYQLSKNMQAKQWDVQGCDQALFMKGEKTVDGHVCYDEACGTYVDDCMGSVKRENMKGGNAWDDIGSQFNFEPCDPETWCPKEMLGQRLHRWEDDEWDHLVIEMYDYTMMIVADYMDMFPDEKVVERTTPFDGDPRDDESDEIMEGSIIPWQHMGGMLLWLGRCLRMDISFGTSCMCRRFQRWTKVQQRHMTTLVGYLKYTARYALHMRMHKLDTVNDLRVVVDTDADFRPPRSQSGWIVYLESDRGSFTVAAWGSKVQAVSADSVGCSELIAAHNGVREAL